MIYRLSGRDPAQRLQSRNCGKFARTSPQLGVLTAIPVNEMVRRLISTVK